MGMCEMMNLKILSNNEIREAVKIEDAIEIIRNAFIQFSHGKSVVPLRTQIPVDEHHAKTLFMPAYLKESRALGIKIISIFPENRKAALPAVHAVTLVVDTITGQPQAFMNATYLTALRTGGVSGVATDLLARKDAHVVAVMGAGIQGRAQLEAICAVRSIENIFVYDIDPLAAHTFVREMGTLETIPSEITMVQSPHDALSDADILCTATTSSYPIFQDEDLREGTHINGIGSYTPYMQEIPEETVARSKIIVDSLEACLAEAGDLIIPLKKGLITEKNIHGQLGDILSGMTVGRETDEEITFFKSVGLAIQDVAISEYALRRARELDIGHDVEL